MYDDDSVDSLSDREIEALVAHPTAKRIKQVRTPGERVGEIKPRMKRRRNRAGERLLTGIPGAGLNQDVEIMVTVPAYLVAGMKSEGELNLMARLAFREFLERRGKTWWYPRFRSALMAEVVENE